MKTVLAALIFFVLAAAVAAFVWFSYVHPCWAMVICISFPAGVAAGAIICRGLWIFSVFLANSLLDKRDKF